MSNDTVRKEIEDFWDGDGEYEPFALSNSEPAVNLFLSRNIVIPRTELPEVTYDSKYKLAEIDGENWAIEGVWEHPQRWRDKALNYLAIAGYLETEAAQEAEATAARDKRRNEVAAELWPPVGYFGALTQYAKNAIDRIIELEASK